MRCVVLFIITLLGAQAHGYSEWSHAHMTKEALSRSNLALPGNTFFIDLGIYGIDGELLFPRQYWDMQGSGQTLRKVDRENSADVHRFEKSVLEDVGVRDPDDQLRPSSWILRGTIREDDTGKIPPLPSLARWCIPIPNPWDDSYNPNLIRVFNHFFDPINNVPLNGPLVSAFIATTGHPAPRKAPDWALGVSDAFAPSPSIDSSRLNHFSIADMREAMWRALTGTKLSADGVTPPTTEVVAPTFLERSEYWATTFRAIGDVVHLVQDLAQPQHTRNDAHSGIKCLGVSGSAYEERMATRVRTPSQRYPAVDYGPTCGSVGGLCPVAFNRYADYFSGNGKGIADYSNRGFFSAGTNLGDNSYPAPSNDPASFQLVNTTGIGGRPIQVLVGTVPDSVFSAQQVKLTAVDPFYEFAAPRGISSHYLVTDEVIDDHASLLLPRAVAYTSGLVNYIFRGRLQTELPDENIFAAEDFSTAAAPGAGFRSIKLKVKNATPSFGGATQSMDAVPGPASLIAVISYRTNTCLQVPSLDGVPYADPADTTGATVVWQESCRSRSLEDQPLPEIIASKPIKAPPGMDTDLQTVTFYFDTPIPFNAVDLDLRIVYRGPLGTEADSIALAYEYISEPNFFNFDNNRDCKGPPLGSTTTSCKAQPSDPSLLAAWEADCTISGSVKLPFWNAADEPGWRAVASVNKLLPGQYARVAYLARSAQRRPVSTGSDTRYLEVASNQRYAYDVLLTRPDGSTASYSAKQPVTSPLLRSRRFTASTEFANQPTMYEADGAFAEYGTCPGGCWGTEWANSMCDPIDPTPQHVIVDFP